MVKKREELFELFLECHGMTEQYVVWKKNGGPKRTRIWMNNQLPKGQAMAKKIEAFLEGDDND